MDWLEKMNGAVDYIECNLTNEISYDKVAHKACCSRYHFLRMFPFITNVSLAEYIRQRRLTLAGIELQTSDVKVIDLALKYGYESPEAFSRAFKIFHGITPVSARDKDVILKVYPKLTFQNKTKILEDFMENAGKSNIVKIYKQKVPAVRFIGKKYGNNDRVNGMFSKYWDDWHENGWFDLIKKQTNRDLKTLYEDGDACIGLMCYRNGEFEYWIGLFMPEGTTVPEGYRYLDFPEGTLGVCWLHGKEEDVFCNEEECSKKLEEAGYEIAKDEDDTIWCMERYCSSRFTASDDNGKVILDVCFYVK
jgi:AraC family transcriptional regulator